MQNEAFIKNLVTRRWDKSGDVERNALIDLMVAFESPDLVILLGRNQVYQRTR